MADGYVEYGYRSVVWCHVHSRILPAILRLLQPALNKASGRRPRVLDAVLSTEVVEHPYAPRPYARGCFEGVRPGGRFVRTTPYHGYLKNLAISVCGQWDSHANRLWVGGHIKLSSLSSLSRLLTETGFRNLQFAGVGRMPGLWRAMAVADDRPAG
jgi:2-polyprenyl-6-hydroxyphenyl methylase/3-demethylubiquinone-9 3-methyltransferase